MLTLTIAHIRIELVGYKIEIQSNSFNEVRGLVFDGLTPAPMIEKNVALSLREAVNVLSV